MLSTEYLSVMGLYIAPFRTLRPSNPPPSDVGYRMSEDSRGFIFFPLSSRIDRADSAVVTGAGAGTNSRITNAAEHDRSFRSPFSSLVYHKCKCPPPISSLASHGTLYPILSTIKKTPILISRPRGSVVRMQKYPFPHS